MSGFLTLAFLNILAIKDDIVSSMPQKLHIYNAWI